MIGTHDTIAPRAAVDLASSFEAHLLGVGKQGRTTAATYARLVRQYLAFLGETTPNAVTRLDVEAYLAVRGSDGSSSM